MHEDNVKIDMKITNEKRSKKFLKSPIITNKTKNFKTIETLKPISWIELTCLKALKLLQGDSLFLTTKSPHILVLISFPPRAMNKESTGFLLFLTIF